MSVWDIVLGGLNGLISAGTSAVNYWQQSDNLKWQKEAQQTVWDREDNAVQRKVADLEAAGLNKNLAPGSPAQASGVVGTEAPQLQQPKLGLDKYLEYQMARNQIAASEAQKNLINQQIDTEMERRENVIKERDVQEWNLAKSKEQGLRTNDTIDTTWNTWRAIANANKDLAKEAGSAIAGAGQKVLRPKRKDRTPEEEEAYRKKYLKGKW